MTSSPFHLPFLASANGRLVPPSELRISFADTAFLMGTTCSEQVRTFHGELFLLREHLQRLASSLQTVGTKLDVTPDRLSENAKALVGHNFRLLRDAGRGDWDLGLGIFVTAGTEPTWRTEPVEGPLVGMYTYPLDFGRWAESYTSGVRLVVSQTRQVSPENWPLSLKCRSRAHYLLAARQVAAVDRGAVPLLLNLDRTISETPTANVIFVEKEGDLVCPESAHTLPGISLNFVQRLAADFGWRVASRAVVVEKVADFSEIWLTSTPFCALPVVQVDQTVIGDGRPGPAYQRLVDAWADRVGCRFQQQARFCAAIAAEFVPPGVPRA